MLTKPYAKRLLAFAAVAAASVLLAGCEESSLSPLSRSFTPIPPKTVAAMEAIGSSKSAPVLIRAYKKEAEFEIWKMKADGRYAHLKSFPLCRWSGQLGPKVREGDRQVPEGFYSITPARMNPNSAYYLSFDVGYPNAYDRALGRTGGSIMVHGACSSAGCFSMTDAQIAEIYAIAREAFAGGQRSIQMQSYPFRMTAGNLAKYRLDPNIGFWNQLKEGSDNFEVTKQDVLVGACGKHYVFNSVAADGSQLNATGPCPALKHNDDVHNEVAASRTRDETKIAELAARGVRAVRTVYADGGQHPDMAPQARFASRPEALAQGPADVTIDESKQKKTKLAAAAKPGAKQNAPKPPATAAAPGAKPAEPVTVAATSPEPAKPQEGSFFSRWWGAKPAEAKMEPVPDTPATPAAAPAQGPAPLPQKRNEASSAGAKGGGSKDKPRNSVEAPAPAKPHAEAQPSGTAAKAVAMLRAGFFSDNQAQH
ncbi:MAG: murein L,D-transpeptidase [Beijerinckiaceae bacterium]|nr:murein L,D-transpeptidase [Beijerinckiaceae bacterium]